jgi:hypothetical protein
MQRNSIHQSKMLWFIILGALILAACSRTAWSKDIFVDNSSTQSGDGTTASPYLSIQKAVDSASPGDAVRVRAGSGSYNEAVILTEKHSGTPGNPVSIIADSDNFDVVINGGQTRSNGFKSTGTSHFRIIGFKIVLTRSHAIWVRGPNITDIKIENNYTHDTGGSGIGMWGTRFGVDPASNCNYVCATNVRITNNIIEKAANTTWGASGSNEHITVANGVKDVWIENNIIRNSLNEDPSYQHGSGGEGIDLKEGVENAYVSGNKIYDIDKYGIYLDAGRASTETGRYTAPPTLRNIHVFNNLVYRVEAHGIGIVSEARIEDSVADVDGRLGGKVDGVFIYNNTVYDSDYAGILVYDYGLLSEGFTLSNVPKFDNVRIFNNISHENNNSNNSGYSGIRVSHGWGTNIVISGNVTSGNDKGIVLAEGSSATITDDNIRDEDPMFSSTSSFSLDANSPALDAANESLVPPTDHNGLKRPFGAGYDIGAIEFSDNASVPMPPSGLHTIGP